MNISKDDLYVTVFEGDQSENLETDNKRKHFGKNILTLSAF